MQIFYLQSWVREARISGRVGGQMHDARRYRNLHRHLSEHRNLACRCALHPGAGTEGPGSPGPEDPPQLPLQG